MGSTLRNPDATSDPSQTLFNVAGARLGTSTGDPITWGEWSLATGRSEVVVTTKRLTTTTSARIVVSGLVPGGLYSVYWGTLGPDSEQPLCPGVERTLPLDAVRPDDPAAPNAFRADGRGKAKFDGALNHDLLAATQVYLTVVWHYSGQSSYPFPNLGEQQTQVPPAAECRSSFGHDTMRQLLVLQKW